LENLKRGDHVKDLGVVEGNIRVYLRKPGWEVRTGFIWLRIRTCGGL
jgi:hypothetical protein